MLKSTLLMLTLAFSVTANAQSSDSAEILKVIQLYLRVTDYKDSSAIAKAFHPEAKLMSVSPGGELKLMTQTEWWRRVSRIATATVRESKIKILNISGIAATVKVDFLRSADHISLLKFGHEWKIVNKTLSIPL